MNTHVRPLDEAHVPLCLEHFQRHWGESGRGGDKHFMPFAPGSADGPKGLNPSALNMGLHVVGWQRWWVLMADTDGIVGHANLKSDGLWTGLHRCELGIGLERPYRGKGYGRRLMDAAIEFARAASSLKWIDLRVFAHNTAGIELYKSMGFTEIGTVRDRFRIEDAVIDDVIMTLSV